MKIKVGVIFGGESVEHEVSIISALQAISKKKKKKYDVVPIYMTAMFVAVSGIFSQDRSYIQYNNSNKILAALSVSTAFSEGKIYTYVEYTKPDSTPGRAPEDPEQKPDEAIVGGPFTDITDEPEVTKIRLKKKTTK